jgi:hypothetical protein
MEEYESFKLPCSIGHLLVFVGYAIFGGMYLIQLADSLVSQIARSSAKNEALLLVALTENELRGRSKENILDLLSKTRYPPYYKFGFQKYDTGYECIMYGGINIATLEGKFVFYDTTAMSIGNTFATMNGPCDPYNRADRRKK